MNTHALPRRYGHTQIPKRLLSCDMERDCTSGVSHIDNKGYVYCTRHGEQRRMNGTPCRKMRPVEIKKLEEGGTIRYSR